jgi:hypothetical protein
LELTIASVPDYTAVDHACPEHTRRDGDLHNDAASYWAETGIRVQEKRAYRVKVLDMSSVCDWNIRVQNLDGWPRSFRRTVFTGLLFRRRLCVFRAGGSVKVTILNRFW